MSDKTRISTEDLHAALTLLGADPDRLGDVTEINGREGIVTITRYRRDAEARLVPVEGRLATDTVEIAVRSTADTPAR